MPSRGIYGFDDDISCVEDAEREAEGLKNVTEYRDDFNDEEGEGDLAEFIRTARLESEGITEIKYKLWNATGLQNNIDSLIRNITLVRSIKTLKPITGVSSVLFLFLNTNKPLLPPVHPLAIIASIPVSIHNIIKHFQKSCLLKMSN